MVPCERLYQNLFVSHLNALFIFLSPEEMPGTEQRFPQGLTWVVPHKTEIMECLIEISLGIDVFAIMSKRRIVFSEVSPMYDVA